MEFIRLHQDGTSLLVAIEAIQAVGVDDGQTTVYLCGDDCYDVDESIADVAELLGSAGAAIVGRL